MTRFLRRLVFLGILVAAAAWLKQVIDRAEPPSGSVTSSPAPPAPPAAPPTGRPAQAPNVGEPTKAELYERAQELGIKGRSKMSKAQLERAIEQSG